MDWSIKEFKEAFETLRGHEEMCKQVEQIRATRREKRIYSSQDVKTLNIEQKKEMAPMGEVNKIEELKQREMARENAPRSVIQE